MTYRYEDDHVEAVFNRLEPIVQMAEEAIKKVPELKGWYPIITIAAMNRYMDVMETHVMVCPPNYLHEQRVMFIGSLRNFNEPGAEDPPSMAKFIREFKGRVEYESSSKTENDYIAYWNSVEVTKRKNETEKDIEMVRAAMVSNDPGLDVTDAMAALSRIAGRKL